MLVRCYWNGKLRVLMSRCVITVKRATSADGLYTTLTPDTSDTNYTASGLANITYYYRVYAVNSSGKGTSRTKPE